MTTQPPQPAGGSGPSSRSRTASRRAQQRARRRRRNRRIVIGVTVLLAALVAGGYVLTRGGDDESAQTATRPAGDSTTTGPVTATTGAGGTSATTSVTPTTDPRPGGPCKPENLSAAVVTSAVRAAGSVRVVALTNDGRRSCTLEGYPGLAFVGLEGEALTAQVTQGGGAVPAELGVQTVTVQPGSRASFVMAWDRTGSCLSVGSIDVTLPNESQPVKLASLQSVCGNGTVYVSPFQPDVADA